MRKKVLIFGLVIVLIILAVCTLIILKVKNSPSESNKTSTPESALELMTSDEKNYFNLYHLAKYEVLSRDASGKPDKYRLIGVDDPKPIELDLAKDEEKMEKNLASSTKIQVLRRDSNGKIIEYRIIKNDSDILKEY